MLFSSNMWLCDSTFHQVVRSWLVLVLLVAGLWCHPVPDNGINETSPISPLPIPTENEKLAQANESLTDSDYSDTEIITEFFRLVTSTVPTVTPSIKSSDGSTSSTAFRANQSTASPKMTTSSSVSTEKPFEIVTSRLFPSDTTTSEQEVETTTVARIQKTSELSTTQRAPTAVDETVVPVKAKPAIKGTALNEIKPEKIKNVPVKVQKPAGTTVAAENATELTPVLNSSKLPQKSSVSAMSSQLSSLQTATPLTTIIRQPASSVPIKQVPKTQQSVGSNQVQQQQMAVSTIPVQQPNLVQTPAASNGPRQQQSNFAPAQPTLPQQQVKLTIQQKGAMAPQNLPILPIAQQQLVNQSRIQPQWVSSQPMVYKQQVLNQPMPFQQPMMIRPSIQQLPNQPLVQHPMILNPNLGFQQPWPFVGQATNNLNATAPMDSNQLVQRPPMYIRGRNGTLLNLIPIPTWPQYVPAFGTNALATLPRFAESAPVQ